MTQMSGGEEDVQRDHHRQLLAHLNIVRARDDKLSYDDAMWLMMRAAEHAVSRMAPFAREGFDEAYGETDDPVEHARRLIIRSFHGFGSNGHNGARPTGFRANSNRSGTTPAHDWINYPDNLAAVIGRLAGVVIENRPAVQVMAAHDGPDTLHYLDPPYVHATRAKTHNSARKNYRHELTDEDHASLLAYIQTLKGMVVLSGYPHPLYDDALQGWGRHERVALADGARERIEVLWINPLAVERSAAELAEIEVRQQAFL